MRRLLSIAVLLGAALVVPAAPALAVCDGTSGRSGTFTIEVGTAMRTFIVRVPSATDGRTPAPVMFAFHPFSMNAQYMQSRVPGRVWPEAIMIYPEGIPRGGGPLVAAWQGRPGELEDRDVRFFDGMLAWLRGNHCIDDKRVFVMGYSNGAALSYVLACERAGAIAGVGIASGRPGCAPAASKPIIISHGTRDQTIGYEQAIQAVQTWSRRNGCAEPKVGVTGCVAASACTSAPTTLCTYPGGHEYNTPFTLSVVEFFKAIQAAP